MFEDLSARHGLVTDLFSLPTSPEGWARCRITPEQVAYFHEYGFLPKHRVLSDEQVEVLRAELDELTDPAHPGRGLFYEYHSNESEDPARVLFHALGAWRVAPGFHDLLWNPWFTVPASQLLGGPVRFWHDQLFCKPARHGGVVAWHQDYSYWTRTTPLAHLTCWIALDDSTRDNGCLQYLPASHLWPDLPVTGLTGDMDAIMSVLGEKQKLQFAPVCIELEKGEVSFHHPRLVHGSYANDSERPRRAAVINVFLDGVRSNSDEPLLQGVPPIPKGAKIDGRFFPLLLDGEEVGGRQLKGRGQKPEGRPKHQGD
ncbi:MAG TPA: phytanoyl-CoA dioxygenase family protein [Pyrinomonadaceae bacterium]|nr:phytanoyl-CoA dioxygenase family protein [Pyrinomonadaceae bacterium]